MDNGLLPRNAASLVKPPRPRTKGISPLNRQQIRMLASPYPGLDSPIVASAWGKQLALENADSPELERFIHMFLLAVVGLTLAWLVRTLVARLHRDRTK